MKDKTDSILAVSSLAVAGCIFPAVEWITVTLELMIW